MEDEVTPDAEEENHGDDLRDETSNHDLDTSVGVSLGVGSGSQVTTNGLEDEREEIAADEDDGVKLGLETRVLSTDCGDDTTEAEVDTGSEQSRGEGEGDQVPVCNEPTGADASVGRILT